jgi:26S proteasome regulatory subunit N3
MTSKEQKEVKNDQTEAMEIVEDEETKQQRLAKETITGTLPKFYVCLFFLCLYLCSIEIKRNFVLLERAVETIESRFTTRVLRTLPSIRRRLTSDILAQVISDYYGTSK